jgi:hypothetical protein
VGASYKSTVTGRTLASDINLAVASPTLREGGPRTIADARRMVQLPQPEKGSFRLAPSLPTGLMPLGTVRDTRMTSSLVAGGALAVASPGTWALVPAGDGWDARDGAASAAPSGGSFRPAGAALTDPDGISAAVVTMRKFRRMLGEVGDDEKAALSRSRPGGDAVAASHGPTSPPPAGASPGSSWTPAAASPAPLVGQARASVAASLATAAAGSSVVGTLLVPREVLMRATMVASKWTRILKTEYGASGFDPCSLVLEMQHQFYAAFLDDLHEATGGQFSFTTEPSPTGVLANVGAINMLIAQGAPEEAFPHALPPGQSNRKPRFTVIKSPRATADDAAGGEPRPGDTSTAVVPFRRSSAATMASTVTTLTHAGASAGVSAAADVARAAAPGGTRQDAPLVWKGAVHVSDSAWPGVPAGRAWLGTEGGMEGGGGGITHA